MLVFSSAEIALSVLAPVWRVVAAVVVDQVGRVGGHQGGALAGHQALHVVFVGGIATEQAVLTQEVEVAGP